jgi:hypothetical protein
VVSDYFCLNGEPCGVEWVLGNGHVDMASTDTRLHEFLPHIKWRIRVPSGAQHITRTKESPDITKFHSFYFTSLTSIITSQVHHTSALEFNIKLYSEFNSSGKKVRSSSVDLDTTMKPIHGITRQSHCWPGMDPTPWTNQSAKYSAKPNQLSYHQKTHLKNCHK